VVIDISEKTDDFVRSKLPVGKIITDYYFGLVPRIDAMLFPLFVFIAVIFFTAKMADRSEVIAILCSGVSFRRFLVPYWIGSIFLASLLWVVYQFILPRANAIWGSFEAKYVDYHPPSDPRSFPQNYYFRLDSNAYAGIKYYDTSNKMGGNFFHSKVREQSTEV
jgi:lipopolysaccharide export system permease protein